MRLGPVLLLPIVVAYGTQTADEKPFGGKNFARLTLKRRIDALVEQGGVAAETEDLYRRLESLAGGADRYRMSAVDLVLRAPYRLYGMAESFAEGFEPKPLGKTPDDWLRGLLQQLAFVGDWSVEYSNFRGPERRRLKTGIEPEAHLDQIQAILEHVGVMREESIGLLSDEERQTVSDTWRGIGEQFEQHVHLHSDDDPTRYRRNQTLLRIAERVNRAPMLAGAEGLAELLDPDYLEALSRDLERAGLDLDAPQVLARDTPHGRILIAGRADNWHQSGSCAVLIDLGGRDFYSNNQASTVEESNAITTGAALILDLDGDDAYESTHEGAQGAGVLGIGVLVDYAGDDSYIGTRWAQGVGFLGVGVLIDVSGNDTYRALTLSQGVGLWGVGALLDAAGNDRYEANRASQSVGMAGGVALLLEQGGDDGYYCKGRWKTGYGTDGIFEGWGQGCGVGFRQDASGGVALLIDDAGRDRYEAGNFSQGTGYYFGLDALFDRGSEGDVYIGSRYDQGASAHQAVGYFHESGGDDDYTTRNAVAHGLAWDQCVTMFIEDSGDDTYKGGGFSLGASAHNAVCIFWERRGEDTYLHPALGRAGGNDYHGGTSLSVFVEGGGGRDSYVGEDRNGSESSAPEHGFFVDG